MNFCLYFPLIVADVSQIWDRVSQHNIVEHMLVSRKSVELKP